MTPGDGIETRIRERYAGLSVKLRAAADYAADHPVDIATRSLRAVAQTSGVSPATFSRLARALGYANYEQLREAGRAAVGRRQTPMAERVRNLQATDRPSTGTDFLREVAQFSEANFTYLSRTIEGPHLMAAVDALYRAETVLCVGSHSSAGLADFLAYQAQWIGLNWRPTSSLGDSRAAALLHLKPGDAVLGLSFAPYGAQTIATLQSARDLGLTTVAVTDNHAAPAVEVADHIFVVPVDSPNAFYSYAAGLLLLETIIGLLLKRIGPEAEQGVLALEAQTRKLGEHWPDRPATTNQKQGRE